MLELVFHNEADAEVKADLLEVFLEKFNQILPAKVAGLKGWVNLIIVDDNKIHELNRDYRKMDKPTDVLSFAYLEGGELAVEGDSCYGDIFISIETAKKQAEEKGHSLEKELKILFVHGLLHLFGFDHNNDAEEEEMEFYAKKILGEDY